MKKIFLSVALVFIGASTVFISSCAKKCGDGQEGKDCVNTNLKFLGSFKGTTTLDLTNPTTVTDDLVAIQAGSSATKLIITLIGGATLEASASVESSVFSVTSQTVTLSVTGSTLTYAGTGSISGNILTLNYTVIDPTTTVSTSNSFVGTKQ